MNDIQRIPLAHNVWEFIDEELQTNFKNVLLVKFNYVVGDQKAVIRVTMPKNSELVQEKIELEDSQSERLVGMICKKFNLPCENLCQLSFDLREGEVPVFHTSLYPLCEDRRYGMPNANRITLDRRTI